MIKKIKNMFKNISVFNTDASSIDSSQHQQETTFTLLYNTLAVGELKYDGKNWEFTYTKMFQTQNLIDPIPSFPETSKFYVSAELWPFFQARIPSLKQPKIQAIIKKEKVKANDIIGLLKLFGTRSINNPFVLQG